MYKAKFIAYNGNTFVFDTSNFIVFDIDGLSGLAVNNTETQGAGQIGTSVAIQSVGSRNLTVRGVIYNNISNIKSAMRKAFSPFTSGRLIFNDDRYLYVKVAEIPTFSPNAKKGDFILRLLCPYPFWRKIEDDLYTVGEITKSFRFPVNYKTPHRFGTKSAVRQINVINNGDMETDFTLVMTADDTSVNPYIANIDTYEQLKFNYTLHSGEQIKVYRDENGIIRAVLVTGDTETNIMQYLDESSNLFSLHLGDNLILVSDENGGAGINAQISFNSIQVGVFDEN